MDLPVNPHRPPQQSPPRHVNSESDDSDEEEDEEDFDIESFRRAYGGYTSGLQGGLGKPSSLSSSSSSAFWHTVRKGLRRRRRRLARRRREKEREQEGYRAWRAQQAEEDAVLRRWGCAGCVPVGRGVCAVS